MILRPEDRMQWRVGRDHAGHPDKLRAWFSFILPHWSDLGGSFLRRIPNWSDLASNWRQVEHGLNMTWNMTTSSPTGFFCARTP